MKKYRLSTYVSTAAVLIANVVAASSALAQKPLPPTQTPSTVAYTGVSPNIEVSGMKVELLFDEQNQLALRVAPPAAMNFTGMTVYWIPASLNKMQDERVPWRSVSSTTNVAVLAPYEKVRAEIAPTLINAQLFTAPKATTSNNPLTKFNQTGRVTGTCAVLNPNALCDRLTQVVARLPAKAQAAAFPLQEQVEILLKVQIQTQSLQARSFEGSGYLVFYSSEPGMASDGSGMRVKSAPPAPPPPTLPGIEANPR